MQRNVMAMLVVTALAACARAEASPPAGPDRRFVAAIQKAAAEYRSWGRVDEKPNIAPFLCRAPVGDDFGRASRVRMSRVRGPHQDKLYYLWASQTEAYRALGGGEAIGALGRPAMDPAFVRDDALPIGFAVVKESFSAKPLVGPPPAPRPRGFLDGTDLSEGAVPAPITWLATGDGRRLQVDQPKDLFVMVKVGARAGADEGWIYGTVSPGGKVTSAGRVERCMGCHEAANHERLFGLRGE